MSPEIYAETYVASYYKSPTPCLEWTLDEWRNALAVPAPDEAQQLATTGACDITPALCRAVYWHGHTTGAMSDEGAAVFDRGAERGGITVVRRTPLSIRPLWSTMYETARFLLIDPETTATVSLTINQWAALQPIFVECLNTSHFAGCLLLFAPDAVHVEPAECAAIAANIPLRARLMRVFLIAAARQGLRMEWSIAATGAGAYLTDSPDSTLPIGDNNLQPVRPDVATTIELLSNVDISSFLALPVNPLAEPAVGAAASIEGEPDPNTPAPQSTASASVTAYLPVTAHLPDRDTSVRQLIEHLNQATKLVEVLTSSDFVSVAERNRAVWAVGFERVRRVATELNVSRDDIVAAQTLLDNNAPEAVARIERAVCTRIRSLLALEEACVQAVAACRRD